MITGDILVVSYRGQLISSCGGDVRWVCEHVHDSRDAAVECAEIEMRHRGEK